MFIKTIIFQEELEELLNFKEIFMKKLVLFLMFLFFLIGCSEKNNKFPSYQLQKDNANSEWNKLKEEK